MGAAGAGAKEGSGQIMETTGMTKKLCNSLLNREVVTSGALLW
jgi:hypothetical protein